MVLQHKAVSWTERHNTTLPGAFFHDRAEENTYTETAQPYLINSLYDFLVSFFSVLYSVKKKNHLRARKF